MNSRYELLVKELERADALCHETGRVLRVDINLFMILMSGIIGAAALHWKDSETSVFLLLFAGTLISLLFCLLVYRNKVYFGIYLERVKEIEKELGHNLILKGSDSFVRPHDALYSNSNRSCFEHFIDKIVGFFAKDAGNKFLYQMSTIVGFVVCIVLILVRIFAC